MHSAFLFRSLIVLNIVDELAEKRVIVGGSSAKGQWVFRSMIAIQYLRYGVKHGCGSKAPNVTLTVHLCSNLDRFKGLETANDAWD